MANALVKELKATSEIFLRLIPIPFREGIWMSVSDASVANGANKSHQGGLVVGFVNRAILDGQLADMRTVTSKSHGLRRVVKASLGSEALATDHGSTPRSAYQVLRSWMAPVSVTTGQWHWFAAKMTMMARSWSRTPEAPTTCSIEGLIFLYDSGPRPIEAPFDVLNASDLV